MAAIQVSVASIAPSYATFAALLAGFAFTGLCVYIQRQPGRPLRPAKNDRATVEVKDVAAATFYAMTSLAISSFLYANLAAMAEPINKAGRAPAPAVTALLIYGIVLALSVLALFYSVALMMVEQAQTRAGSKNAYRVLSIAGPVIILRFLAGSARDVVLWKCQDTCRPPGSLSSWGIACTLLSAFLLAWAIDMTLREYDQRSGKDKRRKASGGFRALTNHPTFPAAVVFGAALGVAAVVSPYLNSRTSKSLPYEWLTFVIYSVSILVVALFALTCGRVIAPRTATDPWLIVGPHDVLSKFLTVWFRPPASFKFVLAFLGLAAAAATFLPAGQQLYALSVVAPATVVFIVLWVLPMREIDAKQTGRRRPRVARLARRSGPFGPFQGYPTEFVVVRDGVFHDDGKLFRFSGANICDLHQASHQAIDRMLADASAMSLSVVRTWAFADGPDGGGKPMQRAPGDYDDEAFDALDYAIYAAGKHRIRLILALVNNHREYGGMEQYVAWYADLNKTSLDPGSSHDYFYTMPEIRKWYKNYAEYVITRWNPYTGLRYNEDPTIMTFDLANEPRCSSDQTGQTLVAWAKEMSAHIKESAPRQLVAVGDEGFYGGGDPRDGLNHQGGFWKALLELDAVDYGTVHLRPQLWEAAPGKDLVEIGKEWIRYHAVDGKNIGKPVIIEDYGLFVDPRGEVPDEVARCQALGEWTRVIEEEGCAGDLFSRLTANSPGGLAPAGDRSFAISWDSAPLNMTRSAAELLAAHARVMAAQE